jgi:hypothetical protein
MKKHMTRILVLMAAVSAVGTVSFSRVAVAADDAGIGLQDDSDLACTGVTKDDDSDRKTASDDDQGSHDEDSGTKTVDKAN